MRHSVNSAEKQEIMSHPRKNLAFTKFSSKQHFTKDVTKELISRKKISVSMQLRVMPRYCWKHSVKLILSLKSFILDDLKQ